MNTLPHSLFIGDTEMKVIRKTNDKLYLYPICFSHQVKNDVKIEVIESDPLHLYFSSNVGNNKMDSGEIHLTLDQLNGKYRQVWIETPGDIGNTSAASQAEKTKLTNSR